MRAPAGLPFSVRPVLAADRLIVDLGAELRCLSGAVLGGGLATVRTWANIQVPSDYRRTDPLAHLLAETASLPQPVLGMLTAALVDRYQDATCGGARAFATVGLGIPLAAAGSPGDRVPGGPVLGGPGSADHRPGTINILVLLGAPLTDAGLAGALQTAVEAKAQALATAGVRATNGPGFATGTATDVLAVACPPGGTVAFAGPATPAGADLAQAVYQAVLAGCESWRGYHGAGDRSGGSESAGGR